MMGQRKVQRVFIHFPDPCDRKPRYRKRQMVNETLIEGLREILAPGGVVSVKTDREEMFQEMDPLFLPVSSRSRWRSDSPRDKLS